VRAQVYGFKERNNPSCESKSYGSSKIGSVLAMNLRFRMWKWGLREESLVQLGKPHIFEKLQRQEIQMAKAYKEFNYEIEVMGKQKGRILKNYTS